ncbi:DUF6058 family natural product biosynthesis protein [Sphaerisporangium corydalis]|uniref:DUF6058 family natural product biosynthesis protein n=1 Tax=Sphaerisporangium corydalis TaxID=1441875 RepID=A0ABV9ECV3_9ACTN|nr:DUF6058 family natural product biosynthesis protein [Sphaerisporangium corydalis]
MSEADLKRHLSERFREVNGDHPMTRADDDYVSEQFVVLEKLCATHGRDADEVRRLMLDRRLPLPGYLRSDGAEMVPSDLFALAEEAGGLDRLGAWFAAHWADPAEGEDELNGYLNGRYVCLHSVTPENIQRKGALVAAITTELDEPGEGEWLGRLHALVDELDALEPPFTAYDRLRFGGPTSRDTCVDGARARHPLPR